MNTSSPTARTTGSSPRWLTGLVLGIAGLFYAYAVWNAIDRLASMASPNGLTGTGWVTMLFGALFPALVFVFALGIGRRRTVGTLALVLLTGLGVVAVFWLSLLGYSLLNAELLVGSAP